MQEKLEKIILGKRSRQRNVNKNIRVGENVHKEHWQFLGGGCPSTIRGVVPGCDMAHPVFCNLLLRRERNFFREFTYNRLNFRAFYKSN